MNGPLTPLERMSVKYRYSIVSFSDISDTKAFTNADSRPPGRYQETIHGTIRYGFRNPAYHEFVLGRATNMRSSPSVCGVSRQMSRYMFFLAFKSWGPSQAPLTHQPHGYPRVSLRRGLDTHRSCLECCSPIVIVHRLHPSRLLPGPQTATISTSRTLPMATGGDALPC